MAKDLFRSAARKRQTLFNAWSMLNDPLAVELIGEAGWDCVTIDQQHGAGGNETLLSCLTAAKARACRPSCAWPTTIPVLWAGP